MNEISADDLQWLLQLLEAEGLAEIEVHIGESEVVVRAAEAIQSSPDDSEASAGYSESVPYLDEHHIPVLAPVAGIFFRAPSADLEPFVAVGDQVVHGDTVGLVEAMKLFNEVPAPATGVVVSIMAENGQQVAADEPVMVIET